MSDWRERPLLTVPEFAALVGLSKERVYTGIRNGDIPAVKLGPRTTRIPTSYLVALEKIGATDDVR